MDWLKQSIMRTRGLAKGRTPTLHHLSEAMQGSFHYTIGPYSQPVLQVQAGDRIVVDTRDAFEGKVKTEQDLPSKVLTMPFVNPQNGPIMVEGAEKGDVLAVYIESMAPRGVDSISMPTRPRRGADRPKLPSGPTPCTGQPESR